MPPTTKSARPRNTSLDARVKEAELDWYAAAAEKDRAERDIYLEDLKEKAWDRAQRESSVRARRVYDFVADVEGLDVSSAVDDINDWVLQSKDPVTIRLCSPGGSVFDGFLLYDFLREVRESGVEVITHVMGFAASMAAVLSQAGSVRRISKNAWFMVHEPSTIVLGKSSKIRDETKLMDRLHKQLCELLAERSKLSPKQIAERCDRRDWWMSAEEAVNHGFFDELV